MERGRRCRAAQAPRPPGGHDPPRPQRRARMASGAPRRCGGRRRHMAEARRALRSLDRPDRPCPGSRDRRRSPRPSSLWAISLRNGSRRSFPKAGNAMSEPPSSAISARSVAATATASERSKPWSSASRRARPGDRMRSRLRRSTCRCSTPRRYPAATSSCSGRRSPKPSRKRSPEYSRTRSPMSDGGMSPKRWSGNLGSAP